MQSEVWVALIAAVAALGVAIINGRGMRRQISEVHTSTVNSHGTDLRHDVDRVAADLREVLDIVRRVPVLEVRMAEHVAASEGIIRRFEDKDAELARSVAALADALPVVARSTPAPVDTGDPEEG